MTLSIRARLTLFYTTALVAVLCAFAAEVWWVEGRLGLRRVDVELNGLYGTLVNLLADEVTEHATVTEASGEAARAVAVPGRVIGVFDRQGREIAGSWSDLRWRGPLPTGPGRAQYWTVPSPAGGWRLRAEAWSYGDTPVWLVVGSSLVDVQRQQNQVLTTMAIALPFILLLAGGGGFWVATHGLSPITAMARQASGIAANGHERLGEAGRHDELGAFAAAFNGLLDRLREALHLQRQFMADASHELRTPVSIVRTAAEVALAQPTRLEGEYRETLETIGKQSQRLSRLVESMLVLARADAGGYPVRKVDLYLDEVVNECCQAVGAACSQKSLTLERGPFADTPFFGDEDLLRQLVLNVLQNAVQHTPPRGHVSVAVGRSHDTVTVDITDTGDGIPLDDRDRIFERFVRLDPARTGGGAGLGLPIARWIAAAHGGTVRVSASGPGGSTFTIELPARSTSV